MRRTGIIMMMVKMLPTRTMKIWMNARTTKIQISKTTIMRHEYKLGKRHGRKPGATESTQTQQGLQSWTPPPYRGALPERHVLPPTATS
jgi:hypothetical protein